MKKFLNLIIGILFIIGFNSCNNIEPQSKTKESTVSARVPAKSSQNEPGFNEPDDGKYHVYYFIRIDENIQTEYSNVKSNEYFPRTEQKKTILSDLNMGYIKSDVNWKSNIKFSKYIYSPDGKAVRDIIITEPTLEDLVAASKYKGDSEFFTPYLTQQNDLHFIWYACKKQDSDGCWHIDGVLTKNTITDIQETSYGKEIVEKYGYGGEVEVDIHQQEHKDWNEIKTSVHLRDTVDVDIFLPINYALATDDFDIRLGIDYNYITEPLVAHVEINGTYYQLSTDIKHVEKGIKIHIYANSEALKKAFEYCGDGITYEIHSYVSNKCTQDYIWNQLKKSTISVNPKTYLFGQITSAYNIEDIIVIKGN